MRGTTFFSWFIVVVLLTGLMVACGNNEQAKESTEQVVVAKPAEEQAPKPEAKAEGEPKAEEPKATALTGSDLVAIAEEARGKAVAVAKELGVQIPEPPEYTIAGGASGNMVLVLGIVVIILALAAIALVVNAARRGQRPRPQLQPQPGEGGEGEPEGEPQPDEGGGEGGGQAGRGLLGLLFAIATIGLIFALVAPLFAVVDKDAREQGLKNSWAIQANTVSIQKMGERVKDAEAKADKAVIDAKAAAAAEAKKALDAVAAVKRDYIKEGGQEQRWMLGIICLAGGIDLNSNTELKKLVEEYKGTEPEQQKFIELFVAAKATVPATAPAVEQAPATTLGLPPAPPPFDLSSYVKREEVERDFQKKGEYLVQNAEDPFVRKSEVPEAQIDLSGFLKQNENNPFIQADALAGFKAVLEVKISAGFQDLVRLGVLTSEDLVLLDEAKKAEKEGNPMPAEVRQASIVGRVAKVEATIGSVVDSASRANTTASQALAVGKAAHKEVASRQKDREAWAAYALRLNRAGLTLAEVGFTFRDVRKDSKQTLMKFQVELGKGLRGMNVGPARAQEISEAVTVGLGE